MKVSPGNLRMVEAAVKKTDQGIRKAGQTVRSGLTATVIGSPEEEQSGQNAGGTRQSKIPDSILKKISGERQSLNTKRQSHPTNRMPESDIQRRQYANMQGRIYADMKKTAAGNKGNTSGMTVKNTVSGTKAASGAAAKGASTATKATKGAAKIAGATAKGTATVAGAASGAATAGISTAATVAVAGAVRVAKRTASIAKEALEVSVASKNSSSKMIPGMNGLQSGKRSSGSKSKYGMAGAVVVIMLLPILLFSMFVSVFTPLASLQSSYNGGAGNAISIVAIAENELLTTDENIGGGKYKIWYGMDANWCAMFVSWCANQCGYIDSGIMPKTASVSYMKSWYEQHDQYHIKESGYEPHAGDVVIFLRGRSHTGLVVAYDSDAKIVTTIEGNTGTSSASPYHVGSHVRQKQYPLTYTSIDGYCSPSYPGT